MFRFSFRRGYRTRFLDVKIVSLRNELRCRKLDARVNFLEAKLNRYVATKSLSSCPNLEILLKD